jgi:molybdopterin synthase sulfur carrier subunit
MGTPIITVHLTSPLRKYAGGASRVQVAAINVRTALQDLERTHSALYSNLCDETGALRRHLNVFVNSDNIRDLKGVETALAAGDVLTFLPAVSGG